MKRMLDKKDSRMPGGRAGCRSVAASHRWRQQGIHSGGLFQIRAVFRVDRLGVAQEAPVDVRPQVFAADSSAGGFFDRRAVVRWHSPTHYPVVHSLRRNANSACQSAVATHVIDGGFYRIHVDTINTWGSLVNTCGLID